MYSMIKLIIILSVTLWFNEILINADAIDIEDQLNDIIRTRIQDSRKQDAPSRRIFNSDNILGAPSRLSHLPPAEPMLPGHTLLRPAFQMLKSSVKFPHKELENGAGVYGNIDNWGIRYDGRNERVLYTGFRRMPSDYIMIVPKKGKKSKPRFTVTAIALDLDKKKEARKNIMKILNRLLSPKEIRNLKIYAIPGTNGKTSTSSQGTNLGKLEHFRRSNKTILLKYGGVIYKSEPFTLNNVIDYDVSNQNSAESNNTGKKSWFWNSKNKYDHIKIPEDAPKYSDMIPDTPTRNKKQWWYFNQEHQDELTKNT